MADLVVLVPDKNTEYIVRGALGRAESLGIRQVDSRIIVETGRDGGVRTRGSQLLNTQRSRYSHAVMLMDFEGAGSHLTAPELEIQLNDALNSVWGTRARAIVVEPEVDVWMWGAESHLRETLDWSFDEGIRDWLRGQDFAFDANGKPLRPKEALDKAFRRAQVPRSSARYGEMAERISLTRCTDPAFLRLRQSLVSWFGDR